VELVCKFCQQRPPKSCKFQTQRNCDINKEVARTSEVEGTAMSFNMR